MHRPWTSSLRLHLVLAGAAVLTAPHLLASGQEPPPLADRVRGSERVVVARAERVSAAWRENQHGDRVIVSRVLLRVEETLKGTPETAAWLEVEGGTLDGLTLHVSDLPSLEEGERGVFFLDRASGGVARPHGRGQGILKLDDNDVVVGNGRGNTMRLSDIRRSAQVGN